MNEPRVPFRKVAAILALASLTAHGGFVVVGGALGRRLPPQAAAGLRVAAGLFMAALAVYFALD